MKQIIFKRRSELIDGDNIIRINFNENTSPQEAAKILVEELQDWNPIALNSITEIVIN